MSKRTESEKFRRGIKKAIEITGVSGSQASVKGGYSRNQVARFLSGNHKIMLKTLADISTEGFGMTLDVIYRMGAK